MGKRGKRISRSISHGIGEFLLGVHRAISTGFRLDNKELLDQRVHQYTMDVLTKGKAKLSPKWHTPDEYLDAARELMGDIDIDPATDEIAQLRIRAKVYYTRETNGLDKSWLGRMWLGTPYADGLIEQFTEKAIQEYLNGNMTEGVILTHTNNTHYDYFQNLLKAAKAICMIRDYIRWVRGHEVEEEAMRRLGMSWSPEYTKHGNIVFYFGDKVSEFVRIFSRFGVCYVK